MSSTKQQARTVAHIWEQAITEGGQGAANITDSYITLFREHQEGADIASAATNVSRPVATAMWERLKMNSEDVFYYSETDSLTITTADQVFKPSLFPVAS